MSSFPAFLPVTRTPDPATAPPLRWGVLGPGGIANAFTSTLHRHTQSQVVAVGSRSSERAAAFAALHGINRSYGSYEQLVADADVDVVYVASPHSEHHDHALLAIGAGKHVLVEKAFTRNAAEAAAVVAAARAAKVFAMEAMWTRFLPGIDVVRQLLADGAIGEVATVLADHGQYFADLDPSHRLLNPALAGGALLDLGIYPVSFAAFALGIPDTVHAHGDLTSTGVDAQVSIAFTAGSTHALLSTTLLAQTPTTASISGSAGFIEIPGPFYAPAAVTVSARRRGPVLTLPLNSPIVGADGLCYQAAEVARCIADGRSESPLLPLDESVAIMGILDQVRAQVGVIYPGE